ncbi:Replication protein A 70 kDa DNA-binding subunit B [Arachis hypogaea]|nr:Replication protein A 70 kDa DNA-binding subunit B [Arachis hypogaea]
MAGIHKIADINPTIDNLCVRIRVIRLWTLPSYGNSPLPYSIEMVWLDEDGGKIHASVKKAFVSRFVNLLEEGISYQIRYFGVGLNKGYFKTTHHEYVVNLNQRTDVHRLPESSSIPRYGFKFVSFDTLNAPGYDCTYLVDVVGYLAGIGNEKTLEKDGKSTKYTVIELEIDDGKIMECALFDNYAHELNAFLGSGNKDGAVVVLQFVRVKLFNEKIVLQNSMYGTKMFFNLEDTTVIQFKNSFVRFEESTGNIGGIPNEAAFLKIYQGKTIEQLKEFETTGGTANVNATVFDKEAKQVLGKSCVEILDPLLLKGDLSDTPTLLLNLIDKTFLFIVEVQISDNPHFSPSYKVKKMTDNVDLINKFKEAHPIQIDVDYTGGLLPISKTSSIIEGEKVKGAKNLLLEFSNEVAANDESELLENAITPTKRLCSESEESKVEGDTSTSKKIKIEKET